MSSQQSKYGSIEAAEAAEAPAAATPRRGRVVVLALALCACGALFAVAGPAKTPRLMMGGALLQIETDAEGHEHVIATMVNGERVPVSSPPTQPHELSCSSNSVVRQPVDVVQGHVPAWLDGTYYHALDSLPAPFRGGSESFGGVGGVVSVAFEQGSAAVSSLGLVRAGSYEALCGDSEKAPRTPDSGIITITQACGEGNICAQYVEDEPWSMNARDLTSNGWVQYTTQVEPPPLHVRCLPVHR